MNKSKEVYTAVDAKGSFTIYEGEVPFGDVFFFMEMLFLKGNITSRV